MKTPILILVAFAPFAFGCGSPDSQPESDQPATVTEEAVVSETTHSGVPDPCELLTMEEAASLGGTVETGAEEESAWPNIRRCTWDGSGDGFYGVIVVVNTEGFESARQMMAGEELAIEDLGSPAFFETVEGGVAGIGIEMDGTAIHVQPVWTDRPAPDSERATALKSVARAAAGRL